MLSRIRSLHAAGAAPPLFVFGAGELRPQLERCDEWRGRGLEPAAAVGFGLGELAAAYAAGTLSRDDAVAVGDALEQAHRRDAAPCVTFTLALRSPQAKRVCAAAPVRLEFAGMPAPETALAVCAAQDADAARAHLGAAAVVRAEQPGDGVWHTTRLSPARGDLPAVSPREPRLPLYLGATGGDVGSERLDAAYWHWMARRPFYFDEAARAAVAAGYVAAVDAGGGAAAIRAVGAAGRGCGRPVRQVRHLRPPARRRSRSPAPAPAPSLLDARFQEELRRGGPVHHLPDRDVWLVLGYAEAREVMASPDRFSSRPFARYERSLLSLDPPEHTAPRRSLRHVLGPAATAALGEHAEEVAAGLARGLEREPEFDVLTDYAQPLSEAVIARMLGIDPALTPAFAATARGGAPEPEFALVAQALEALPEPPPLIAKLAGEPGIDAERARKLVTLLWVAGSVTTRRLIGLAALTLAQHPGVREQVTADPALLAPFVEETLRFRPPEQMFPRVAVRDTTLAGVPIPAGADVQVSLRAANHDPARFPDPRSVRFDRPPHLAFGAGPHRCPGARLGRLNAIAALRALLDRMPGFLVAQPPSTLRWMHWPNAPVLEQLVLAPASG